MNPHVGRGVLSYFKVSMLVYIKAKDSIQSLLTKYLLVNETDYYKVDSGVFVLSERNNPEDIDRNIKKYLELAGIKSNKDLFSVVCLNSVFSKEAFNEMKKHLKRI